MFNTTNYEGNSNLNHNDTSGCTNQNTCSFSPLYNQKGGEQQMSGRKEGFVWAHTWGHIRSNIRERCPGCGSSNRLLAHISMDQEVEIKTGSRAKLESSAPPCVPPLGTTAQRSFTTAFPSLGTRKALITWTYVSMFYICTMSFCSWPPWTRRQVIIQKSFKSNFKIPRIFLN